MNVICSRDGSCFNSRSRTLSRLMFMASELNNQQKNPLFLLLSIKSTERKVGNSAI